MEAGDLLKRVGGAIQVDLDGWVVRSIPAELFYE
jgi:hypothetical protein